MSESIQSNEIKQRIINEKHEKIPTLMKEFGIVCWIIFARETITTPDSVMNLVVGTDVVLHSAFIFGFHEGHFQKIAIVANFDANEQKSKGNWDEVIGYVKSIKPHLLEKIQDLNPQKIALNYSLDDYSADGLTHGLFLSLQKML